MEGLITNMKAFHFTQEGVMNSQAPVNLLAARDGYYEIRQNVMGVFVKKVEEVEELPFCREGFRFLLPKIPYELLEQILSFFRYYAEREKPVEAFAQILWDTKTKQYFIHIPPQKVGTAWVDTDWDSHMFEEMTESGEPRYIAVLQIHSHHHMEAVFSKTDDACEKATMLYVVVGRLNEFFPTLNVRAGIGGRYITVDPAQVFEKPFHRTFPSAWKDCVEVSERGNQA